MLHLLAQCKEAPARVWEGAKEGEELYRLIKGLIKEDIMKPSEISLRKQKKKKKVSLKTLLSVSSNKQLNKEKTIKGINVATCGI